MSIAALRSFMTAVLLAAFIMSAQILVPGEDVANADLTSASQWANYEMLVMGDSVVWGQGLLEDQKFYTLVRKELARRLGHDVNIVNKSHSGATIMSYNKTNLVEPGEVPLTTPTLWQQLEAAIAGYHCEERVGQKNKPSTPKYRCKGVDLVLLNGGINDIGVPKILNPLTSEQTIKKASRKYCYQRMKEFLDEVLATFDNATVVVTGYFQIICAGAGGTNPNTIRDLVKAYLGHGKKNEQKIEKTDGKKHDWLIDKMSEHSAVWKKASDDDLKMSVDDANKAAGASRAIFVKVDFSTAECYNASDTKFFRFLGYDADKNPITDDFLLKQRIETFCPKAKPEMKAVDINPFFRSYLISICKPAGSGHPNVKGAQRYADAILTRLGPQFPVKPSLP